jgi:hypothetical protein
LILFPDRIRILFEQVDQRSRLGALDECKRLVDGCGPYLEIDEVLVDLALVLPERHTEFVEADVAPKGFHLFDGFAIETLCLVGISPRRIEGGEQVVALV